MRSGLLASGEAQHYILPSSCPSEEGPKGCSHTSSRCVESVLSPSWGRAVLQVYQSLLSFLQFLPISEHTRLEWLAFVSTVLLKLQH